MNIAEALERERWPLYVLEFGGAVEGGGRYRPGALMPGVAVTVHPGTPPPAWESARRLVEGDDA